MNASGSFYRIPVVNSEELTGKKMPVSIHGLMSIGGDCRGTVMTEPSLVQSNFIQSFVLAIPSPAAQAIAPADGLFFRAA
jgi:hypothetical protein